MTPAPGTNLGPYRIEAPIGAGGMGAVYKARDTRLDRTVAIKIVEGRFSERFEREAKTIASLNHPHICTLHDVGENYLVMEYIEGAPVSGPLPLQEVLRLGAQIADALDAAHRKGITHRDLKPGNVLISKAGAKVIDFGLAKAGPVVRGDFDLTMTTPLTGEGAIVGTICYMSPEQLQGHEADARSDIFALGCVLYEMLTGKRAFDGKSPVSIMAAILEHEPAPLSEVQPMTPAWLDRVIRRCLRKDPDDRWQSARDVAIELREPPLQIEPPPVPKSVRRSWWPVALAVATIASCAAFFAVIFSRGEISGRGLKLTPVALGDGSKYEPAFSPDGKSVAYLRRLGGRWQLMVQSLGSGSPTVLVDSMGGGTSHQLLWSPDGARILYSDTGGLWRIGVAGGTPDRVLDRAPGIAAWLPTGTGLLGLPVGPRAQAEFSVSEPIGSPWRALGEVDPVKGLPHGMKFSPDGRKLAVATREGVWVGDWPRGARRFLPLRLARTPNWFPDNRHVLVASFGQRQLVAFDSESDAFNVVRTGEEPIREASLSADGRRVIYNTGPAPNNIYEYSSATPNAPPVLTGEGNSGRWTSDGRTFVFRRHAGGGLFYLLARDEQTGQIRKVAQLDFSDAVAAAPSPDGKRIAYLSDNKLWTVAASGGPPLAIADCDAAAVAWSPDGAWLVFRKSSALVKAASQGGSPVVEIVGPTGRITSPGLAWTRAGIYSRRGTKLARIAAEGGAIVELADLEGAFIEHASPDERVVYARRIVPEGAELVEYDAMTGATIRVVRLTADGQVRRLSVHPDGKRIAAEIADANFDLWMMEGFPTPAAGWERLFWRWLERPAAP